MASRAKVAHEIRLRRFLTTVEAADYLRMSRRNLERLRVERGGPTYVKLGRLVRYAVDDLDRWAEAARRISTRPVEVGASREAAS